MLRKSLGLVAVAALLLAAAPAVAQGRHGGDHGGQNRGGGNNASHNNGGGAHVYGNGANANRSSGNWNNSGANNGHSGSWNGGGGNHNTYPPLFAGQRNDHRDNDHGGDRDRNRGENDHRVVNNYYYDRDHKSHGSFSLGFSFGYPYASYYDPFYYDYYAPGYASYNSWGLAPYECRVDYEFGYWYGRPADIQVRRCADAWGNVYVVEGGRRLYRYR